MSTRIDRTGQIYGQLTALCDTGKTKESNRVWSARCTCGRVIETHQLGRKKGPQRCPECAVATYRASLRGLESGQPCGTEVE